MTDTDFKTGDEWKADLIRPARNRADAAWRQLELLLHQRYQPESNTDPVLVQCLLVLCTELRTLRLQHEEYAEADGR